MSNPDIKNEGDKKKSKTSQTKNKKQGAKCLCEVRYEGITYQVGDSLPADIDAKSLKRLKELKAVSGK